MRRLALQVLAAARARQQRAADARNRRPAQHAADEGAGIDQRIQVQPGGDAHAVQHEDHVLGGHVAGGALGVGAAAQAGDAGVEHVHPHLQTGQDIGQRLAVGVVEVPAHLGQRIVLERTLQRGLHAPRRAHADGVGDADVIDTDVRASGAPPARPRRR
jgi:hypothetical protein